MNFRIRVLYNGFVNWCWKIIQSNHKNDTENIVNQISNFLWCLYIFFRFIKNINHHAETIQRIALLEYVNITSQNKNIILA